MRVPITARLLRCADLIPPCETVADVGTDHGYLGIYLLRQGTCRRVIAADLREKPLASARTNAALYGVADSMDFIQSDGLHSIPPGSFQTLVCAGMGGDLITAILRAAPWLRDPGYTVVLQPQSAAQDLRRALGEDGWTVEREALVRDGRFLYTVLRARWSMGKPLSPGEQYVSPALRREGDPLYGEFLARMRRALELTVAGIEKSSDPADAARLPFFREALDEIKELKP